MATRNCTMILNQKLKFKACMGGKRDFKIPVKDLKFLLIICKIILQIRTCFNNLQEPTSRT